MKELIREFNKKDKFAYTLIGILGLISMYLLVSILIILIK